MLVAREPPRLDGLYYLRNRYYDPSTGQFISRDPASILTRQPYSYVSDNPLNSTDPAGLWGWNDFTNAVGNAVSGAASWENQHAEQIAQDASYAALGLSVAAAGCAVIAAPTVVGETVCGAIEMGALGAGLVTTAVDTQMAAEGRGSWTVAAIDAVSLGVGGGGRIFADSASCMRPIASISSSALATIGWGFSASAHYEHRQIFP